MLTFGKDLPPYLTYTVLPLCIEHTDLRSTAYTSIVGVPGPYDPNVTTPALSHIPQLVLGSFSSLTRVWRVKSHMHLRGGSHMGSSFTEAASPCKPEMR